MTSWKEIFPSSRSPTSSLSRPSRPHSPPQTQPHSLVPKTHRLLAFSLLPDPGHVATKNGTGGGGVGLCVRRIGDNGAWQELEVHFVLSKLNQKLKRYYIGRCWQRPGVWSKSKPAPWISHIRHDGRIRSVCTQRSQTGAFREPRPPAGSAHHGLPHILHQAQAEKS